VSFWDLSRHTVEGDFKAKRKVVSPISNKQRYRVTGSEPELLNLIGQLKISVNQITESIESDFGSG
jgi:uncharacterized protein YlxP (DUF503 family)